MKRKKLLSTAVAGALVAAQMVMPVAAADGGNFDVSLTTKTPVLRVVVPTSMEIAVNQFEMSDAGSQIYSSAFTMENKSEIPVKLTVTSTATVKDTTKLVATKAAATGSTTEGEAWLAAAAQTSAGKYIEESGKTIADLTEESANVTTFAENKAEQVYYLNASNAMAYKLLNANEDATDIAYAQFYELTALTFDGTDDQGVLDAALKGQDIYYIVTGDIGDGKTITKESKNDTAGTLTYAGTNTYYTMSATATAKDAIVSTKLYVYGDGSTDTKGAAAFRYIGKLSGANETWTEDDIEKINVAYTIVGVQQTDFDAMDADGAFTYGFYKAPAPAVQDPSITAGATVDANATDYDYTATFTKGTDLVFTVDFGNQGATAIASAVVGGKLDNMTADAAIISFSGSTVTVKGTAWSAAASGVERYCRITLDDSTAITIKLTVQ